MGSKSRNTLYSRILPLGYFAFTGLIIIGNLLPPDYRATGTLGYYLYNPNIIPVLLINGVGFLLHDSKVLRALKIFNIIILILVVLLTVYSFYLSSSAPPTSNTTISNIILYSLLYFALPIITLYFISKLSRDQEEGVEQSLEKPTPDSPQTSQTEKQTSIIRVISTLHAVLGVLNVLLHAFFILFGLLIYQSFGETYSEFVSTLFSFQTFKLVLYSIFLFTLALFLWNIKQSRITPALVLSTILLGYSFLSGSLIAMLGIPLSVFTIIYLWQLRGRLTG